jgi:hypothetical protein
MRTICDTRAIPTKQSSVDSTKVDSEQMCSMREDKRVTSVFAHSTEVFPSGCAVFQERGVFGAIIVGYVIVLSLGAELDQRVKTAIAEAGCCTESCVSKFAQTVYALLRKNVHSIGHVDRLRVAAQVNLQGQD